MTHEPVIERVLLDPPTAAGWLAGVPADYVAARLDGHRVVQLMDLLRSGRFESNEDGAISLDTDGVAIDGLSILVAVVLANVRVWMHIRRDVPRSGATQPDLKDFTRTTKPRWR